MSISRTPLWRGQQRVDVPHLRAAESGILADFDLLGGKILAGDTALVVRGFAIEASGAVGADAETLVLNTADSAIIHPLASEPGSLFRTADDAGLETLSASNSRVDGSFTASSVNFVGIDLVRTEDDDTVDTVMFIDSVAAQETAQRVALARTLDYRIVISTVDFSSTPHVCPIAKVTTGASNQVTALEDARQMFFRLGAGGTSPDQYSSFPWADGRIEGLASTALAFTGGDKIISSEKDWKDAVMTRLWEVGGGQHWYSASSDRELKVVYGPDVLDNGDNYKWTLGSETLEWSDVVVVFANSTGTLNEIVDGDETLEDGECLYVDIDRSQDLTGGDGLIPAKASWDTLGSPSTPGTRFVLAWRVGDFVYARDKDYEVGRSFVPATETNLGIVQLTYAAGGHPVPLVAAQDANGRIHNTATANNAAGFEGIGHGTGPGIKGTGAESLDVDSPGSGGLFTGGEGAVDGGHGLIVVGGVGADDGGRGVYSIGGAAGGTGGIGLMGVGGVGGTDADGGTGVSGHGTGQGVGVNGVGGSGGTGGIGVKGLGTIGNPGVQGTGGNSAGSGVKGIAGSGGVGLEAVGGSVGAILATVTGDTVAASDDSSALKMRNSGTGANTKVLAAWLHGAVDTGDDGWSIYTHKTAEDNVEMRIAQITDGVVGSDLLNIDATSFLFNADMQVTGELVVSNLSVASDLEVGANLDVTGLFSCLEANVGGAVNADSVTTSTNISAGTYVTCTDLRPSAAPAKTSSQTNILSTTNIPKAFGLLTVATGALTYTDGHNITSVAYASQSGGTIDVTLGGDMADGNYVVVPIVHSLFSFGSNTWIDVKATNKAAGTFRLNVIQVNLGTSTISPMNLTSASLTIEFIVMGRQP